MRILLFGFVVFIIWSFFSVWLYLGEIRPVMNEPVAVQAEAEAGTIVADTLPEPAVVPPADMVVYFEFDSYLFIPRSQDEAGLKEMLSWLDTEKGSALTITGHTDSRGSDSYNNRLGMKRAEAVAGYLYEKGADTARIITLSRGETEPADNSAGDEARAMNRRTVITINK